MNKGEHVPSFVSMCTILIRFLEMSLPLTDMAAKKDSECKDGRSSKARLEVRATDDGKTHFVSLPLAGYGATGAMYNAIVSLGEGGIIGHATKRTLSLPTHGHHATIFYGCTKEEGEAAIRSVQTDNSAALDWKDCVFEDAAVKIGEPNPKRKNSQCWVLKIKSWPMLWTIHEAVKKSCIPDDKKRAEYRAFMPHVTIGFVQDV